jgi:putative ABC transport system substrate-binding protein
VKRRPVSCIGALLTVGLVMAPSATAQQPIKVPVIGMLMVSAGPNDSVVEAFRLGLREQGYVDGRNLRIEFRSARGRADRLPRLADELVRLKVDVLFAAAEPSLLAAKRSTSTIPIVVVANDYDLVASGLIVSYARPGGNVTGVSTLHSELVGKQLELLKEAVPGVSRVAVLWDSFSRRHLKKLEDAARLLNIELQPVEAKAPDELEPAFKVATSGGARALVVLFSPAIYVQRSRIARIAVNSRLATIYEEKDYVEAGGFMSYGANYADTFGRAAYFVVRILKGAKPAELPVEQPARFELTINLRTAKVLGLAIPPSILARADRVIQ